MQGHLCRSDQFYVIILKVIRLVSGLCLANFCWHDAALHAPQHPCCLQRTERSYLYFNQYSPSITVCNDKIRRCNAVNK